MDNLKKLTRVACVGGIAASAVFLLGGRLVSAAGQAPQQVPNSYIPVNDTESFATVHGRMTAAKPGVMKRQMDLLGERYDLSDRPASGVVMDRSKPVQEGVRVKLPSGVTWTRWLIRTRTRSRLRGYFPRDFFLCRTRTTPREGWCFRSRSWMK